MKSQILEIIKSFALLAGLSILCFSCEDVIELDLPDGEVQLVVDGWFTDQNQTQSVRLTQTANFFSNEPNPGISDALVILFDDTGELDTLAESDEELGTYITSIVGIPGRSYFIYIRLPNGNEYASDPQLMRTVPKIDSIYAEFQEENPFQDEGFYIRIDTQEPQGVGDFYRWRQFINGVFQSTPEDLVFASDEFVDGNPIIGFEVGSQPLQLGDTCQIDQLSISREAFDYLALVQEQTLFQGSLFDPPPAPIRGNIQNLNDPSDEPLGFFGVSAVESASLIITE